MAWRRGRAPLPPPAPAKDYSLALAEARRRLDSQLAVVDASRGRVTGLLGVGGLIGTFVGGLGATQTHVGMTPPLWTAGTAFGVAVAVGLLILAPWKFHASMEASGLVNWGDAGHPRSAQERDLALHIERQVTGNGPRVRAFQWGLLVVVLALAVEFCALSYQLIRST